MGIKILFNMTLRKNIKWRRGKEGIGNFGKENQS